MSSALLPTGSPTLPPPVAPSVAPTTTLLDVRGLCIRSPGRTLVEGVDITVRAGRVTALCGPSGAGKSLCARVCMGIVDLHPGVTAGQLRYPELGGDEDWLAPHLGSGPSGWRRLRERTGTLRGGWLSYAPQAASSALNPGRTIGWQLALALSRRRAAPPGSHPARPPEIVRLLDRVGLPPSAARSLPGELSGGMCQRAALAVAMAPSPRLLIADEPETGLDPVIRRQIVELLVSLAHAEGCGLLLISHHEDTVDRVAHDVVRLGPARVAA